MQAGDPHPAAAVRAGGLGDFGGGVVGINAQEIELLMAERGK